MAPLVAGSNGPPSVDLFGDDLDDDGQEPWWSECLRGTVVEGFSLVVYEGGSVEELVACAQQRAVTAVYVLADGEWVSYILGAPEFANQPFRELFAEGLPSITALVARSEEPPVYWFKANYSRVDGSVRSQGASTLRRHKATSLVVYAAASSLISECQRVRKSRRCSVNATWAPPRRRTRKYCRSSSNALQKRDADSKLPKPCIG